jgi:hypothetical protein
MTIKINPKYKSISSFIYDIPKKFNDSGDVIYKGRNTLKSMQLGSIDVVIKSFKKPNLINRIIYTYLRKSKAERSYLYSQKIQSKGFITPEPIAFILMQQNSLISESFYICTNQNDRETVRLLMAGEDQQDYDNKIESFAKYSANLHSKGILHLDYSAGNILYRKDYDTYSFSLIDVNRLKFQIPNKRLTINNLNRISTAPNTLKLFANSYCHHRGWSHCSEFTRKLEISSDLFHINKAIKHSIKDLISNRRDKKHLFPVTYFSIIRLIKNYFPNIYNRHSIELNKKEDEIYNRYLYKYDNRKIFSQEREYPIFEIAYLKIIKSIVFLILMIYLLNYIL